MIANEPAAQAGATKEPPSFARATVGFLGSTFLTAALMVLVSAL